MEAPSRAAVRGSEPVPPGARGADGWPATSYARYLEALMSRFGKKAVARWNHPRFERVGARSLRMTLNGALFLATKGAGGWRLRRALPFRRRLLAYGPLLGTARCRHGLTVVALAYAPVRPPRRWTYAAWRASGA